MVRELRAGADVVLGNRFSGTIAPGAMPWLQRYVGKPLFSMLLRLFFGTTVGDVHCGMRGFTRVAYERMALHTTGMEFASEMIARAARLRLRVAEVPVDYHPRAGESKLRVFRDGWRHLRFLLLYSPTWLFIFPGAVLSTLGLAVLLALSFGTLIFVGRTWDMHASAVASLLTVLGVQLGWLGISARTVALLHGFEPHDAFLERFYRLFSLEGGLALAGGLLCAGLGLVVWVIASWIGHGFPPLDEIRPLLLGATLIIVAAQCMFNAFFLSLLSIRTRGEQTA
jgi:hypothetical protein